MRALEKKLIVKNPNSVPGIHLLIATAVVVRNSCPEMPTVTKTESYSVCGALWD